MEPEASELPKGLALSRDENIHIRITPMGDVGSHIYTDKIKRNSLALTERLGN